MAKLRTYGMLTSGEIFEAEHNGKLSIADHLCCPFCDGKIHTKTGERKIEQPFCQTCGVFLTLVWEIHQDHLQVQFAPGAIDVGAGENEILQSTGYNIQLSRQRDGTIADEILAFLDKQPIAETAEIRKATQSSPQGFSLAIKKLIAAGEVRKVKRGWYERITADTHAKSDLITS